MNTKLFSVIMLLMLSMACSHEHHLSTYELGIDFQSSFENDHTKLVIGGSEMLSRELETNHLLGVCSDGGQLSYGLPEGDHKLTVTVNHSVTRSIIVPLHRSQYVGVLYDRQNNEIAFHVSDEPFGYD